MKRTHWHKALFPGLLMALGLPAYAVDKILELTVKRGCLVCHQVKHDPAAGLKMAPSYEEIAARYKNDADAAEYLTKRILIARSIANRTGAGRSICALYRRILACRLVKQSSLSNGYWACSNRDRHQDGGRVGRQDADAPGSAGYK